MLVVTVSCCTVSTYAAELPDQRAFSFMRATGHFDMEVPGNSTIKADKEFPLEIGETVAINAVYSPQTASVDFGLIAPDGLFYGLNTMFTGDRYIITEETAGKTEYKDDFFYVPASYRNRDNDYALEMFRLLYGSMKSVRVSAWKPA